MIGFLIGLGIRQQIGGAVPPAPAAPALLVESGGHLLLEGGAQFLLE